MEDGKIEVVGFTVVKQNGFEEPHVEGGTLDHALALLGRAGWRRITPIPEDGTGEIKFVKESK